MGTDELQTASTDNSTSFATKLPEKLTSQKDIAPRGYRIKKFFSPEDGNNYSVFVCSWG